MTRSAMRLGDMLVTAGLVTREDLARALHDQAQSGMKLGEVLVRRGLISEHDLTQILSHRVSVAWVCLDYIEFTRELLSLLPAELAAELNVIPVYFRTEKNRQKILYVAVDDPTSVTAMEQVAVYTGMHVRPLVAPASEIKRAIQQHYFNTTDEKAGTK
jgi:type IV pilus assembly protein PilB